MNKVSRMGGREQRELHLWGEGHSEQAQGGLLTGLASPGTEEIKDLQKAHCHKGEGPTLAQTQGRGQA